MRRTYHVDRSSVVRCARCITWILWFRRRRWKASYVKQASQVFRLLVIDWGTGRLCKIFPSWNSTDRLFIANFPPVHVQVDHSVWECSVMTAWNIYKLLSLYLHSTPLTIWTPQIKIIKMLYRKGSMHDYMYNVEGNRKLPTVMWSKFFWIEEYRLCFLYERLPKNDVIQLK